MHRSEFIQMIINKLKACVYLEIGVFNGYTFLKVKCVKKIGVDPCFVIPTNRKLFSYIKYYYNIRNEYYKMSSNEFFENHNNKLISKPPQVVFIDGLHTFEQTLQDCYNSLNYLETGGIIILHDCNPPTEASATPALSIPEAEKKWKSQYNSGWTDEWCGDTWKTIPFLINNNPELNVSVLNTDYGLGIVSRKNNLERKLYQIPSDINKYKELSYSFLDKDRENILNLKKIKELNEIINFHFSM